MDQTNFNTHTVIMFLFTIYVFSQGFFILVKYRNKIALSFSILIILTAFWSLFNTLTQFRIKNIELEYITKFIYFLGTTISMSFYIFCHIFIDKFRFKKFLAISVIIITTFPLYMYTDLIIGKYYVDNNSYHWEHGKLAFIFFIEFFYFVFYGLYILIKEFFNRRASGMGSSELKSLIACFSIGFIPPIIFSIILPLFGNYSYDWLAIIFTPFWFILIWFNIVNGNLFTTKTNVIEIILYLLSFSLFSSIMIVKTLEELFIFTIGIISNVILSIYIIKISQEKNSNEKVIERLSKKILYLE